MKKILEFAKFADIYKSTGTEFDNVKYEFNVDEKLIDFINIKKNYKLLKIDWYNTKNHDIIERIKTRTKCTSISEFNKIVERAIKKIIPSEIGKKIDRNGRYSLYLTNYNFYLIIQVNYNNLLQKNAEISIVTISRLSGEDKCLKIIEIN